MPLWRHEGCLGEPPLRWIDPILWVRGEAGFRREAGGGGVMDLAGQTYGRWKVSHEVARRSTNRRWQCVCECGTWKIVYAAGLRTGTSKSCGCLKMEVLHAQAPDLLGKRFGRLTVIRKGSYYRKQMRWLCRCDCGNERLNFSSRLQSGRVRSCGCLSAEMTGDRVRKHGAYLSTEYVIWRAMLDRCRNPNRKGYANYGGRGIRVCRRWRSDFAKFLADMGKRPDHHSIERVNNSKGYSPANCKWASRKEQNRNHRGNRMLEYKGKTYCLAEWCERLGLSSKRTSARLCRGWDVARAFTQEVR